MDCVAVAIFDINLLSALSVTRFCRSPSTSGHVCGTCTELCYSVDSSDASFFDCTIIIIIIFVGGCKFL